MNSQWPLGNQWVPKTSIYEFLRYLKWGNHDSTKRGFQNSFLLAAHAVFVLFLLQSKVIKPWSTWARVDYIKCLRLGIAHIYDLGGRPKGHNIHLEGPVLCSDECCLKMGASPKRRQLSACRLVLSQWKYHEMKLLPLPRACDRVTDGLTRTALIYAPSLDLTTKDFLPVIQSVHRPHHLGPGTYNTGEQTLSKGP